MAQAIAVQPYVMIDRVVKDQEQTTIQNEFELHLYETKITSSDREFPIQNVHDMSFKKLSGEEGFLYLHTNKGVYTFRVKNNPNSFISAFMKLSGEGRRSSTN